MAKKKWKFTDLSDDVVEETKILEKEDNFIKNDFNLNINEFSEKKEHVINDNNQKKIINDVEEKKVLEKKQIDEIIDIDKNQNKKIEENNINTKILNENINDEIIIENKKINEVSNIQDDNKEYKSKYDINIDYDSEVPIKQQIKQQQEIIKSKNLEVTKLKTFNETLNSTQTIVEEFNSNKIQQFFTTKEKLDVKTNIYLKPNLVHEIQVLSKKTGESRSAIINKLIEHALKDIKSN